MIIWMRHGGNKRFGMIEVVEVIDMSRSKAG